MFRQPMSWRANASKKGPIGIGGIDTPRTGIGARLSPLSEPL